jgi:uncharacterized protein
MENLKTLIEVMARALVENPDSVDVRELEGGQSSLVELRVAREDLGAIIGKHGQNIDAMRAIVGAAGAKFKKRIILDVID